MLRSCMRETCFFSSTVESTVSWVFEMFLADFTVVGISSVFHGQPWYFLVCRTVKHVSLRSKIHVYIFIYLEIILKLLYLI